MSNLHAVIMAGGSGTRFWPASRALRPKQFLPLADGISLLAATVARVAGVAGRDRTWIVTNAAQAARLHDAVADFPADRIIIEPEARDTAPCVALAAATIGARDPGAVLAVMPADHVIQPVEHFARLLQRGAEIARQADSLVTFGIKPTRPATTYGYIERDAAHDGATPPAHRVKSFQEKPKLATAQAFLASGRHAWNSGIFVWTIPTLLAAMEVGSPALATATRAMRAAVAKGDADAVAAAFRTAPKTSIDYAVMEKAPRVIVVTADLDWSDVGSFVTLDAVAPKDSLGNVTVLANGARAWLQDAKDCVAYAEGPRLLAMFGVENIVAVAVGDAVLVCPKERADELKAVVERLRGAGWTDIL